MDVDLLIFNQVDGYISDGVFIRIIVAPLFILFKFYLDIKDNNFHLFDVLLPVPVADFIEAETGPEDNLGIFDFHDESLHFGFIINDTLLDI